MSFRIGQGFDVHALVAGRRLVLGGVHIPYERNGEPYGLLGHSDADVLLHAMTDALLGAAGQGDIGRLFPDTDPQHRDADSLLLLALAARQVRAAGWLIENIDATVVAQQPKIAPYVPTMQARIADALEIAVDAIGIKGKTSEQLGFTGRGEGMAAFAVALLRREVQSA